MLVSINSSEDRLCPIISQSHLTMQKSQKSPQLVRAIEINIIFARRAGRYKILFKNWSERLYASTSHCLKAING